MKFTSLDEIVRNLCAVQLNDPGNSQYLRAARAVRSAINEVNLTFLPNVKSELLDVDSSLVVPLPPDVISITKVGMLTRNGKIITLIQDPQLRVAQLNQYLADYNEYCECEEPPPSITTLPPTAQAYEIYHNCLWWGGFYGELYAAGNGMDHEGGWRHNIESGVLEMATGTLVQAGVKVLVEYKSLGDDNYKMVPITAAETIEAFALYKLFSNKPNLSAFYMQEFRRHAAELKRKTKPFDTLGVLNAFMRGQKATVK